MYSRNLGINRTDLLATTSIVGTQLVREPATGTPTPRPARTCFHVSVDMLSLPLRVYTAAEFD